MSGYYHSSISEYVEFIKAVTILSRVSASWSCDAVREQVCTCSLFMQYSKFTYSECLQLIHRFRLLQHEIFIFIEASYIYLDT